MAGLGGAADAACKVRHFKPQQEFLGGLLDRTVFDSQPKALGPHAASSAAATGGASRIRRIVNLSGCPVTVRTVDGRGGTGRLVPPGTSATTDFLVPVAEDERSFADHHLVIAIDGRDVFWLWQQGRGLRHVLEPGGFRERYSISPGVSLAGGDRLLAVALGPDGRPTYTFRMIEAAR